VRNALARAGITTVDALAECTRNDLLDIRDFGPRAMAEVERAWQAWQDSQGEA
jgi:hypothetical protein